jgi:hypothetical protein
MGSILADRVPVRGEEVVNMAVTPSQDLPQKDIDRAKSHLAKYDATMGDEPPWER